MDILFSIVSFIAALGLLIAVHEFGHFWVARKSGVRVLRFSIGFGKALWRKQICNGETEFVIAAIPLGGYVKMLDEREGDVAQEDRQYAFNTKPLSSRMAIVAAGPIFNLVFAVILYWGMYVAGISGLKPIIGEVSVDSIAAHAGLQAGDEIIAANGQDILIWDTFVPLLLDAGIEQKKLQLDVVDDANQLRQVHLDFTNTPSILNQTNLLKSIGLQPWTPIILPIIKDVVPDSPADKAGLQAQDHVIKVNGEEVASWQDLVQLIKQHPNQAMQLIIERDKQHLEIKLMPESINEGEKTVGRIGAYVAIPDNLYQDMMSTVRYSPLAAVPMAIEKTWLMTSLTLRTLGQMLIGNASLQNISGPITIARYAGKSAANGISSFLSFLAIISLSLGVLNLLPIPVLDGGHLLYNLIEMIKGSPVSDAVQAIGQQIGMSLLMLLMALAIYNDIQRLFN